VTIFQATSGVGVNAPGDLPARPWPISSVKLYLTPTVERVPWGAARGSRPLAHNLIEVRAEEQLAISSQLRSNPPARAIPLRPLVMWCRRCGPDVNGRSVPRAIKDRCWRGWT